VRDREGEMSLPLQSYIVIIVLLVLLLRLPQKRVRGSEGFEGFRVQISGSTPGVEAASA